VGYSGSVGVGRRAKALAIKAVSARAGAAANVDKGVESR
jgi:hypothetical protein